MLCSMEALSSYLYSIPPLAQRCVKCSRVCGRVEGRGLMGFPCIPSYSILVPSDAMPEVSPKVI